MTSFEMEVFQRGARCNVGDGGTQTQRLRCNMGRVRKSSLKIRTSDRKKKEIRFHFGVQSTAVKDAPVKENTANICEPLFDFNCADFSLPTKFLSL